MRFTVTNGDARRFFGEMKREYLRDVRKAAIIATERASKAAQTSLKAKIRSVGLKRLGNAVGQTSSFKRRDIGPADKPYGVIFARGGDESLAGGALESYSRGAVITARQVKWLAIATRAVPKFVTISGRRFRNTPQLYKASTLGGRIGQLIFKPISSDRAVLVVRNVTLSPKTGRALADTGRKLRTRTREKEVVAFVLIRVTTRGKRFDKDAVVGSEAKRMPEYLAEELDRLSARRRG
jgi:hypothetical protein